MPLPNEIKTQLMAEHRRHETDTGSTDVQVSLLTGRIKMLTEHFKQFKKDFHSRHGLQKLVNRRRKLLKYIKSKDRERYYGLIKKLSLRDSY